MKPTKEQIDAAKTVFEATSFEGDVRVGMLMALKHGRILLRYIEQLERESQLNQSS